MKTVTKRIFMASIGLLAGALSFWAIHGEEAREFNHLAEHALCEVELPAGASSASASFTTSRTLDRFHVGVRPGGEGEALSLSISAGDRLLCSVTTESRRFSCGREIPPGTYSVVLRRDAPGKKARVVIAGEKPVYVTGWQIESRVYVGLLLLSAAWAFMARKSKDPKRRATSVYVFQMLLLGFMVIFLYLFFHEGGHALGEMLFGRYDFARSDFWGIHGTPHSAGKPGPALEPWQQAAVSGGGPMLPTLVGWGLFLLWRSRFGRRHRNARPLVNLYFSTVLAAFLFAFVAAAGCLLGILSDGDWRGFITNVPGPPGFVKALVWLVFLVNVMILWRVAPELVKAWEAQLLKLHNCKTSGIKAPGL